MEPVAGVITASGWSFGFNRYYMESNQAPIISGYSRRCKSSSTGNGKAYFSNIPANYHPISLVISVGSWSTSSNTPSAGMAYVLYDYDTPSHYVVLWTGVASSAWSEIVNSICANWNQDGTYYDGDYLYINDMRIWNTLAGASTIILHVYTTASKTEYSTHIHQTYGSNVGMLYYAKDNKAPTNCQIKWPAANNRSTYNTTPYFKAVATDADGDQIQYKFETYKYNNGGTPTLIQEQTTTAANSGTEVVWHATTACTGDAQNKYIIKVTPIDTNDVAGTSVQYVFTEESPPVVPTGLITLVNLETYRNYTNTMYNWYGMALPTWTTKAIGDPILHSDVAELKTKIEGLPNTASGAVSLASQYTTIRTNTSLNNMKTALTRA